MSMRMRFLKFMLDEYWKAQGIDKEYYCRIGEQYCEENNCAGFEEGNFIKWAKDKGLMPPLPKEGLQQWFIDQIERELVEQHEAEKNTNRFSRN